jgi:hypothetical protein
VVFFSANAIYPRCFGIGLSRRFKSEDYDLPGYGLSAKWSCHWRWQGCPLLLLLLHGQCLDDGRTIGMLRNTTVQTA